MAFTALAVRSAGSTQSAAASSIIDRAYSSSAPGVSDDTVDGFIVGSIWEKRNTNGSVAELYQCTDATAGAAVWKKIGADDPGNGRSLRYIEEQMDFTVAAANKMFSESLPVGAIPVAACINNDTAVTAATATNVAFGTSADPDGFGLGGSGAGFLSANVKKTTKGALCGAIINTAVGIGIFAADSLGAAAGSFTAGKVRARLYYEVYDALPDA